MKATQIANGAYFVQPYSVQTLTRNYSPLTAQPWLQSSEEDDERADDRKLPLDCYEY
jgi:hypothetical protein